MTGPRRYVSLSIGLLLLLALSGTISLRVNAGKAAQELEGLDAPEDEAPAQSEGGQAIFTGDQAENTEPKLDPAAKPRAAVKQPLPKIVPVPAGPRTYYMEMVAGGKKVVTGAASRSALNGGVVGTVGDSRSNPPRTHVLTNRRRRLILQWSWRCT
jgi:hypothetical protein